MLSRNTFARGKKFCSWSILLCSAVTQSSADLAAVGSSYPSELTDDDTAKAPTLAVSAAGSSAVAQLTASILPAGGSAVSTVTYRTMHVSSHLGRAFADPLSDQLCRPGTFPCPDCSRSRYVDTRHRRFVRDKPFSQRSCRVRPAQSSTDCAAQDWLVRIPGLSIAIVIAPPRTCAHGPAAQPSSAKGAATFTGSACSSNTSCTVRCRRSGCARRILTCARLDDAGGRGPRSSQNRRARRIARCWYGGRTY